MNTKPAPEKVRHISCSVAFSCRTPDVSGTWRLVVGRTMSRPLSRGISTMPGCFNCALPRMLYVLRRLSSFIWVDFDTTAKAPQHMSEHQQERALILAWEHQATKDVHHHHSKGLDEVNSHALSPGTALGEAVRWSVMDPRNPLHPLMWQ